MNFQEISEPERDLTVTEDSKKNLVIWEKVTAKYKSSRKSETSSACMAYGCVPWCVIICETSLSLQLVALFVWSVCYVHSPSTSTLWGYSSVGSLMRILFSAHFHIPGRNVVFLKALPWCVQCELHRSRKVITWNKKADYTCIHIRIHTHRKKNQR